MTRRHRTRVPALGLGVLLLSGCGGTSDLSGGAAQRLGADVDQVTAAARAQDVGALQTSLQALRRDVEELEASGEVSSERASRILAAAARVATDVEAPAPAPAPPAPAPPAPEPAESAPAEPAAPTGGGDRKGQEDEDEDSKKGDRRDKD